MPKGGFGNLIALPLQLERRASGNTEFLDDSLLPWPDQWAYLASLPRMDPPAVEAMAREAAQKNLVLGLRTVEPTEEEAAAPWLLPPSRRVARATISGPLPASVRAVLANRLFVEKEGLPSPLLSQLKRVAAFQNPEFYKKQGMRLSTAGTPRVIGCAEDFPNHQALPRCCLGEVQELFADYAVQVDLEDQRNEGQRCAWTFQGEVTPVQAAAARALSRHDSGLFVAPPGAGKTVLGAWLVAKRARSTLILVHRANLLDQWVAQLSIFLGVDPRDVGQVGGGKRKPNGRLDVAMFQSLVRKEGVDDLVAGYGHVLVDECHHAAASSYERLLAEVKARYVVGLTATPQRRDGLHPVVEMQLGPVRYTAAPEAAADRPVAHRLLVRPTSFRLPGDEQPIQQIYGAMVQDEARNSLVLQDLLHELDEGRSPLLLTERRDHLDWFAERLRARVPHLVVLQGGRQAKARQELEREGG